MSNWKIDRRRLLTGAGAIFALPLLESLFSKRAIASGTSDPLRFISLYCPDGTYNIQGDAVWYPQNLQTGPLTAASFSSSRSVFNPFTSEVGNFSVLMHPVSKARDRAASTVPNGGGHASAVTTFLSQAAFTDAGSNQCTVPGSSFDQMIADSVQKPNLVLSGGCNSGSPDGVPFNYADYVSYTNGQPNEPHKNPVELFQNMFSNLVSSPTAPVVAAARNHSILDSSLADINDMKSHLGKTDNQKLDSYFTSIRDLETRLFTTSAASACAPGTPPDASLNNTDQDGSRSNDYDQRVQAFFDMVVLAFKCDLVRSVSFMFDAESASRQNNPCPTNLLYNNADLTGDLHLGISHYGINQNGDEKCISRDRNYLSLFFYLIDALKQATDPSGSAILDNTIALMGFGVTDGQHNGNYEGVPLIYGGGKNIAHPGMCVDLNNADMIDVFYTISTYLKLGWTDFQGSKNVLSI